MGLTSVARHPFWRDERGLHAVWEDAEGTTGDHTVLVVTTFDPSTGEPQQHRVYEPFPVELYEAFVEIVDAVGAPDGRFAAVIAHASDIVHPEGTGVYRVVFGHLDDPTQFFIWVPPWSTDEKSVVHVGWDGEAFAVHAADQLGPSYVVTRLDWDGKTVSEVLPPTEVGTMEGIRPGESEVRTDPETGITWVASLANPGVWMSGHYRDGTPLPGVGPMGGSGVMFPGSWGYSAELALAQHGETAFVAWTEYPDITPPAYTASMDLSFATLGAPLSLELDEKQALMQKTAARTGAGWALMAKDFDSVQLYTIGDDGTQARRELVTYSWADDCPYPVCDALDLRVFSSIAYGDELWFGFWDQSDAIIDGHARNSYRIVRVKDGCTYKSMFDIRSDK